MRIVLLCLLLISRVAFSQVDYVNPLMGTDSKGSLSTGNTYPSVSLPWGMNSWTPQTGERGDGWMYTYDADKIRGFKQTHQPSPWMNDYGQFSIMPVTGKSVSDEAERASWFSHKAEISQPYYYSVYLADHDVTAEMAPTERAAVLRFTFPETDSAFVVVDGSSVKIVPSENKIIGYSTQHTDDAPANFRNYFVIRFDKPFTFQEVRSTDADHASAIIGFKTAKGEKVSAFAASSFISHEQAELNLRETADFETVKSRARDTWNKELGRIKVEGGTVDQTRTFYSCLYRMMLFPRKFYEINAAGKIMHYSPYNGQVLPGYLFTDTGFWDTFRAVFPFFNLMYPSLNAKMQAGLVNAYKESGWLPEWASPGHRNSMIGSNSASVIADAYLKNGRGYDIATLYEAVLKNCNNEGPLNTGRKGVQYYNTLGYVPYDVNINENAARTLEYAYDDFCVYRLAKALHKPEADLFRKRAMNYKNLFDPSHKLMRGKNADGTFQSPFNPFKWGDAFTEGNSWHYTWSVFHDIKGLITLMGGKKQFTAMLDSVFVMPPLFEASYYGGNVIHEIREMQIMHMGQYAHGNQPIQHMIYLYNYAGEPWKTQYWVREVMDRLYSATPDGYCGDEDNGQTSAWYVFSAMGFYPVCPATDQYVLGAPLFKKIKLSLENGKQLVIVGRGNGRYVSKVSFNGSFYSKNWVSHQALMKGGVLQFDMSLVPSKGRGVRDEDAPYSLSGE
ncbi:GH92 family glycosyl hydrolase [Chitinophaga tropicalis]|uniref:Glycoside hydrolase family 92 protein n=1 Tax=Chitinophaga tropicalis TaxID=2683588 RepID=A0A7K1UCZ6_9BACT|nr:GH92 family glycosyl hydrolase [Chitinophaga tropicalis]MVT12244.1 glycoside hydrolase family 92 protein [Chitinophaga tropicalis]